MPFRYKDEQGSLYDQYGHVVEERDGENNVVHKFLFEGWRCLTDFVKKK